MHRYRNITDYLQGVKTMDNEEITIENMEDNEEIRYYDTPFYQWVNKERLGNILNILIKRYKDQQKKEEYLFIHDLSNENDFAFSMVDDCYLTDYNEIRNFILRMCRHMHTISNCWNCKKCFHDECIRNTNKPYAIDEVMHHMDKIHDTVIYVNSLDFIIGYNTID